MRMLITDDDPVGRNLLHAILLPYGKCETARDGKEALAAFEEAWAERRPYDLIFLDVKMPVMDGQEALKQIRASEKQMGVAEGERARVLMVTAARDLETVRAAHKLQCDAYLVKPIQKDRVLDELGRLKASLVVEY